MHCDCLNNFNKVLQQVRVESRKILSQNRGLLFRPVLHQRRVHTVHGVHALHPPPPDAGPHHRREVHFQDPEDRSEGGKVLPEHRRGVALRERSGKSWG